jgi:hypothetical protein
MPRDRPCISRSAPQRNDNQQQKPEIRKLKAKTQTGSQLNAKGGRKKKMTKVTYMCRSAKKKSSCVLFFLIDFFKAFFGRFVTRGVQNTKKPNFEKIHLGSSQKMRLFFPPFFFSPWDVLFDFFYHVFGRFVTRGVQKRD